MMFWGFRSRWMTPWSWAALSPSRDLPEDVGQARSREPPNALENRREVFAFDELHGEELDAVELAEIVNPQDVLVRDLARELDLPLEALERIGVVADVGPDELQGHIPVELLVVDAVHGAHAAHAEELAHPVASGDLEPLGQDGGSGRAARGPALDPLLERSGTAMVGISGASVDGATMVRGSLEKLCEHSRQRAAKSGFGV